MHAGCFRELIHQLSGCRGTRINPVDVGKWPSTRMMIDADQKLIFETLKPRTLDAVAFEQDGRFIATVDAIRLHDTIGKRQWLIDARHRIVHNHLSLFPEHSQDLATSESRSDGIAVRAGMRRQQEAATPFDLSENLVQHESMLAVYSPLKRASWCGLATRRSAI